jgi:hypothetical protein
LLRTPLHNSSLASLVEILQSALPFHARGLAESTMHTSFTHSTVVDLVGGSGARHG